MSQLGSQVLELDAVSVSNVNLSNVSASRDDLGISGVIGVL